MYNFQLQALVQNVFIRFQISIYRNHYSKNPGCKISKSILREVSECQLKIVANQESNGQYIYHNFQHAHALESLKNHLTEGSTVLDVGSGSGYLTACMAVMVNVFSFFFDRFKTSRRRKNVLFITPKKSCFHLVNTALVRLRHFKHKHLYHMYACKQTWERFLVSPLRFSWLHIELFLHASWIGQPHSVVVILIYDI